MIIPCVAFKFGSLVLVGTHDAGAYKDFEDEGDNNLVTSAVYAQEETLYSQLVWGVRFLDIRSEPIVKMYRYSTVILRLR